MKGNSIAFMIGLAVIVALSILDVALRELGIWYSGDVVLIPALVSGGFLTAWLATSRRIALAALLALPAGSIIFLENELWLRYLAGSDAGLFEEPLAQLDSGLRVVLACSIACSIGGLCATFMRRYRSHNKPLQPIAREDARSG